MTQITEKPEIPHDLKEIDEDCLIYDNELGWLPRFNGLMKLANKKGVLLFTKCEVIPHDKGVIAIARCELLPTMEYFAERLGIKGITQGDIVNIDNIVKAYETFLYNKEKIIGEDVGEANAGNLGADFLPYMAATAMTRAQARALKKLLNIKYMVAEEVKFEKAMQNATISKNTPNNIPKQSSITEENKGASDSKAHITQQIESLMKGDKAVIQIVTTAVNKAGMALKDLPIYNLQMILNSIHEHKKKV